MSLAVLDGISSAAVAAVPDGHVRALGNRKIFRLLESISTPAFVAARMLVERAESVDRAGLGLFTVSGWEPSIPVDGRVELHDGTLERRGRQARRMQEEVNPTEWLSGMGNNALCQIAIASGIHGPNLHWVGDGATLWLCLGIVDSLIARGAAPAAVVVAYDLVESRFAAPGRAASVAAGLLVGPTIGVRPTVEVGAATDAAGPTAVEVVDRIIAATDSASAAAPGPSIG